MESDKGIWYVTNKVANRWYEVARNITPIPIATRSVTIGKSIYPQSQKSALLAIQREFYMMKI
jgi:hypothetical protein